MLTALVCPFALAQISSPPPPSHDLLNSVSVGVSVGAVNDRDADFWGWSVDYSRRLSPRWSGTLALTWDRETEKREALPESVVSSYTLLGTVSYGVRDWLSLTTGLAKGFADDDNARGRMEFANGDWATGIAVGFSTPGLPWFTRDGIGISVSYEYNLSRRETSVSADLIFSWSF